MSRMTSSIVQLPRRGGLAGVLAALGGAFGAMAQPASQPATRPDPNAVLIRFGNSDAVITQGEFNSYFFNGPPVSFEHRKDDLMRDLVERKLLSLYLKDHPEVLPESVIDERIAAFRREHKLESDADFAAFIQRLSMSRETYRLRWQVPLGLSALRKIGEERAKDEALVNALLEANPDHFDGSERTARHILVAVAPYETPEQKAVKRAKAERIREELVSGKKTWSQAVQESDYPDRITGGNMGYFTRHRRMQEPLAEAAFKLPVEQYSDVIETTLGFHVLCVTSRVPGKLQGEEARKQVRAWLTEEALYSALKEARERHPPIGVQPPQHPGERPVTSRPVMTRPAATRPAIPRYPTTRPGLTGPTTRPALVRPPATRPLISTTRPGGPPRLPPATRPPAPPPR